MSRPAVNPVYEDIPYDDVDGNIDDGAEIQAAPQETNNVPGVTTGALLHDGNTPPNFQAQRQQYIPPPPPPFDNAPARGYSPYHQPHGRERQQFNGREPQPKTRFAGRSPTP